MTRAIDLGGPGVACSAMRVRRLLAGELSPVERARAEEHLAACSRCKSVRAEIEEEGRALARSLPFDAFAAGVAERAARPAPRHLRRALPALAAGLAVAAAVPFLVRVAGPGGEEAVRTKGAAGLQLAAREPGASRTLSAGEPVPAGARLLPLIQPGGWREAALVLLDADGASVLYAGPARAGPLPESFEWTGPGAEGTLVLVLADEPVDAAALRARVAGGGPAAPPGVRAEVVLLRLRRSAVR